MFVTRKTYKRIGVYGRKFVYYGDFDFWLRAFRNSLDITVSGEIVTNYATGGISNQKSAGGMAARIWERCGAYRRNGYSRLYYMESVLMETAKILFV